MLSVSIDRRQLDALLELGQKLGPVLAPSVDRVGDRYAHEIQSRIKSRSRRLKKRFAKLGKVRKSATGASVFHRPQTPHETTIDQGGIIHAEKHLLAVPLPPALNAKGLAKRKSPRQIKGLVALRSKAGNLLLVKLARGKKRRREFEPWYVLEEQVTIKAQHFSREAAKVVSRVAGGMVDADLQRAFDQVGR